MTITQFLALFHPVKPTRKGWDVCCPAHDDQHPSLGVMEGDGGRIVLNCLAHCENRDIVRALNLTMADLFPDRPLDGPLRPIRTPSRILSPRKRAFAYELHALDLRQAAERILAASTNCNDCDTWTNAERELAMKAVGLAYAYQERATWCEGYADHLREVRI